MLRLNLAVPRLEATDLTDGQKFLLLKNYLTELNEALSVFFTENDGSGLRTAVSALQTAADNSGRIAAGLADRSRKRAAELRTEIAASVRAATHPAAAAAFTPGSALSGATLTGDVYRQAGLVLAAGGFTLAAALPPASLRTVGAFQSSLPGAPTPLAAAVSGTAAQVTVTVAANGTVAVASDTLLPAGTTVTVGGFWKIEE